LAIFTQQVTAAQVLAGLTTDSTKWAGANIANLDIVLSTGLRDVLKNYILETHYIESSFNWNQAADGNVSYEIQQNTENLPEFGTWYLRGQFNTLGNDSDAIWWYILFQDTDNFIAFRLNDDNEANGCMVRYKNGGAATTLIQKGTATSGTASHYYEVTRDGLGNFDLSEDGASIGTANDSFLPTTTGMKLDFNDSAGGSDFDVDELKHTRFVA